MSKITFLFLAFLSFSLTAQEYTLVKSKGIIPDEIISTNKQAYENSADTISRSTKNKADNKAFLLKSHFELGHLMKSGKVLFGDRFTEYVNKVGCNLLKALPELEGEIKFYVVKSSDVNAFSTQQGKLFVNLGLLAQVENEAQLAFVLAHEIAHYVEKHTVERYILGQTIKKAQGHYKNLSSEAQSGIYKSYSKENEFEADKKGFENLFLKAGYDVNEALNIFDVLLYSYLPVDEIEFDTTFFDDEYFKIPKSYFLDEVNQITAVEDYDDSEHFHPNIKKRREAFINYIAEHDVEVGQKFLFSEDQFRTIQKDARYELSHLFTINTNYCSAIYNSYLLLKKAPSDLYLRRNMAYALYALSKYKTYKSIRDVIPRAKNVEGKSQQVSSLFNNIQANELNILALKYNWNLFSETQDDQFKKQYKDLLSDLVGVNEMFFDDFKTEIDESVAPFKTIADDDYVALSKYQKIKYDKKKNLYDKKGSNSLELALGDILNDTLFYNTFKTVSIKTKAEALIEKDPLIAFETSEERMKTIDGGIDSLLIINPLFRKHDGKGEHIYISSEERELTYIDFLKDISKRTEVRVDILDVNEIKKEDVELFNQIAQLNAWVDEFAYHQDYSKLWAIYNSQDKQMRTIMKMHKQTYFSVTGSIVRDEKPKLLKQFFYVLDCDSGTLIFKNYSNLRTIDYNAPIKSFLYDSFLNLKKQY